MNHDYKSLVTPAVMLATTMHEGDEDKMGRPYILHPLSVMNRVKARNEYDYVGMIVAVLHDTVEDTPLTLAEVMNAYGVEVAEAVDAISKRNHETHSEYISRVLENPIAVRVKLADVEDNMGRDGAPPSLMKRYEKLHPVLLARYSANAG